MNDPMELTQRMEKLSIDPLKSMLRKLLNKVEILTLKVTEMETSQQEQCQMFSDQLQKLTVNYQTVCQEKDRLNKQNQKLLKSNDILSTDLEWSKQRLLDLEGPNYDLVSCEGTKQPQLQKFIHTRAKQVIIENGDFNHLFPSRKTLQEDMKNQLEGTNKQNPAAYETFRKQFFEEQYATIRVNNKRVHFYRDNNFKSVDQPGAFLDMFAGELKEAYQEIMLEKFREHVYSDEILPKIKASPLIETGKTLKKLVSKNKKINETAQLNYKFYGSTKTSKR